MRGQGRTYTLKNCLLQPRNNPADEAEQETSSSFCLLKARPDGMTECYSVKPSVSRVNRLLRRSQVHCLDLIPISVKSQTLIKLPHFPLFHGLLQTWLLFLPVILSSVFSLLDRLQSISADFKHKELLFFSRISSSPFISIFKDPFSQLFNSVCLRSC